MKQQKVPLYAGMIYCLLISGDSMPCILLLLAICDVAWLLWSSPGISGYSGETQFPAVSLKLKTKLFNEGMTALICTIFTVYKKINSSVLLRLIYSMNTLVLNYLYICLFKLYPEMYILLALIGSRREDWYILPVFIKLTRGSLGFFPPFVELSSEMSSSSNSSTGLRSSSMFSIVSTEVRLGQKSCLLSLGLMYGVCSQPAGTKHTILKIH